MSADRPGYNFGSLFVVESDVISAVLSISIAVDRLIGLYSFSHVINWVVSLHSWHSSNYFLGPFRMKLPFFLRGSSIESIPENLVVTPFHFGGRNDLRYFSDIVGWVSSSHFGVWLNYFEGLLVFRGWKCLLKPPEVLRHDNGLEETTFTGLIIALIG